MGLSFSCPHFQHRLTSYLSHYPPRVLDSFLRQLLLLLEPLGFVWLCLLVLTFLLCWKRLWRFAAVSGALVLSIFVVGSTDLPGSLLRSLEREFAGIDVRQLPPADAVVMLGGGIEPSRYEAGGFHLTRAGDRLLMAVEMMRLGKAPVLVLGGGASEINGEKQIEADLVRDWITAWHLLEVPGRPTPEMISLGRCYHTRDEAVKVHALAQQRGWKRVLLVTSASHMRRALATFQTAGVSAEPVPCNFMTTLSTSDSSTRLSVPHYRSLEKISIFLHEQVGWMEYRRRSWISPAAMP